MTKIVQRQPIVVVGNFLEKVPFHNTLFISELTVTDPITLIPVGNIGTPEIYRPVAGSKVIYKLTSGSANIPVLDAAFKIDPSSVEYDRTPGALNILTMWYDGVDFWCLTANDQAVPIPTPAVAVSRIGDFGWGPSKIIVNAVGVTAHVTDVPGPNALARVSAFDIITSIHYLGGDELEYTMINPNAGVPTPITNTDPKLSFVNFDCSELGVQTVRITVTDGTLTSETVEVFVTIQDNVPYC
jgi:hypothetical protein